MPYVPVNILLERDLLRGESYDLPYPPGKNEGSFFSGINHNMGIEGSFFICPRDFVLTMKREHITLHWVGGRDLQKGEILNLQLDEPGGDFYFDPKRGNTIQNMVQSSLYLINLGGPRVENANLYIKSRQILSPGEVEVSGERPYTARNVVVHSTQDNSDCVFRVTGKDIYNRKMVEDIQGPTAEMGRRDGHKSFSVVERITVKGTCHGEISVGTGSRFGLPVFLPAAGFIIREMINGQAITGGTIIAGETRLPTGSTYDVRGTYTPPKPLELDGRSAIHLLVSLPSPGNIGFPDFAG